MGGTLAQLETLWSSDNGGDSPGPEVPVTLTSISATYSGGDVAVGTDVTALSGVTVTAYYDDGTSETVTGYTLSGTIGEGENTITVTYEGVATTISVTGVVTELLHSWNLRESVTDTVAGVTMVSHGAAQTANGLEITENDAVCDFGAIYGLNRTYEIDVVRCSAHQYKTTSHGRLFAVDNDTNTASGGSCFLHTHNKAGRKGWHFYSDSTGGWNGDISAELCGTEENGYAKGVFDGKTVKFYVGTDSHVTLYVDGVEKCKTVYPFKEYPNGHVYIGSGIDDSLAQTVVSGLRVYSGKHV
jgi:hypothetical protein